MPRKRTSASTSSSNAHHHQDHDEHHNTPTEDHQHDVPTLMLVTASTTVRDGERASPDLYEKAMHLSRTVFSRRIDSIQSIKSNVDMIPATPQSSQEEEQVMGNNGVTTDKVRKRLFVVEDEGAKPPSLFTYEDEIQSQSTASQCSTTIQIPPVTDAEEEKKAPITMFRRGGSQKPVEVSATTLAAAKAANDSIVHAPAITTTTTTNLNMFRRGGSQKPIAVATATLATTTANLNMFRHGGSQKPVEVDVVTKRPNNNKVFKAPTRPPVPPPPPPPPSSSELPPTIPPSTPPTPLPPRTFIPRTSLSNLHLPVSQLDQCLQITPLTSTRVNVDDADMPFLQPKDVDVRILTDSLRHRLPLHANITVDWVWNHRRWVIWKCASYDRMATTHHHLTSRNVESHLEHRARSELINGRHSVLRRVLERDVQPGIVMVLLLSRIVVWDCGGHDHCCLVELTDGHYAMEAMMDEPLASHVIRAGKLKVGGKLVISHATMVNVSETGVKPLSLRCNRATNSNSTGGGHGDGHDEPRLMVSYNGTKPAPPDAVLGRQAPGKYVFKTLRQLRGSSTIIPMMLLCISRRSPVLFREEQNGGHHKGVFIYRDEVGEEREREKWAEEVRRVHERVIADISARQSSQQQQQQQMGSDVRQEMEKRIQREMPPPRGNVDMMMKLKVVDETLSTTQAAWDLTIWKPHEALQHVKEGAMYVVSSLRIVGQGRLSSTVGTRWWERTNQQSPPVYFEKRTPAQQLRVGLLDCVMIGVGHGLWTYFVWPSREGELVAVKRSAGVLLQPAAWWTSGIVVFRDLLVERFDTTCGIWQATATEITVVASGKGSGGGGGAAGAIAANPWLQHLHDQCVQVITWQNTSEGMEVIDKARTKRDALLKPTIRKEVALTVKVTHDVWGMIVTGKKTMDVRLGGGGGGGDLLLPGKVIRFDCSPELPIYGTITGVVEYARLKELLEKEGWRNVGCSKEARDVEAAYKELVSGLFGGVHNADLEFGVVGIKFEVIDECTM